MSFAALGLTPELLRAVADEGYAHPTPVQSEAIPLVLGGRDVLAGAQTGTGKTAAFVLPLLQLLNGSRQPLPRPTTGAAPRPAIRALVLTPTRELAIQVEASVRTYGKHRAVRSAVIYGGVGFDPQVRAIRRGPAIVVATPGRLLDHVGQRTIDLSGVEYLVLDEADRMLDMGFIRDIRRIIELLPQARQNLLFSATFSDDIRRLAGDLLDRPARVQVTPRNTPADLVRQIAIPVDRERKRELLSHLVRSGRIDQALVFTRTKHGANRLADQLGRDGISAAAIHGNKTQAQRVRALAAFKANEVAILVATDIAARGLDIESLPHVVNFELPLAPEDYVHRIGRTGRAGTEGEAISLVCIDEGRLLRDIEQLLRRPIPLETMAGFAPDRSIRAEPIRLRSLDGAGRGGGRPQSGPRPGGRQHRGWRPSDRSRESGRSGDRGRPPSGSPQRPNIGRPDAGRSGTDWVPAAPSDARRSGARPSGGRPAGSHGRGPRPGRHHVGHGRGPVAR